MASDLHQGERERRAVPPELQLVISVDVEEEGLFSGRFPRTPPGVSNVSHLSRLEFISRDFGFPLTFLVTYQVASDPQACQVLAHWQDRWQAEIGAHLHPWNTPPFMDLTEREPIRSENLPFQLLREKFHNLLQRLKEKLEVTPRSFRMGRFDWGPKVLALLAENGIGVDSSMMPCTQQIPGPDHFLVPSDPFFLKLGAPPGQVLLEVPLTVVPLWPGAPPLIHRFSTLLPGQRGELLRRAFQYVGVAGVQPAMFPLSPMRWAVRLHRRRGGRVITMYFHSSELQPGATPQFPTEAAVQRLLMKIRRFLQWLVQSGPVKGGTLSDLQEEYGYPVWEERDQRLRPSTPAAPSVALLGTGELRRSGP
jgi:hypothetical protein